MNNNDILSQLRNFGIIPVVVIDDASNALSLAEALSRGKIPCAEITYRTAAAEDAIRSISASMPNFLVGAGTILSITQANSAVAAGAKFIVSPGLNPDVVSHCIDSDVTVIPGVQTPSEIEKAISFGLRVVKFFPADSAGGIKAIKALAAAYQGISFIPTGGINAENVRGYLSYDRVWACGGSWMVKKDLISEGRFDEITRMAGDVHRLVIETKGG